MIREYPIYKSSRVQWLGKIPEHWEIKPGLYFFREKKIRNIGLIEKRVLSLSYGKIVIKPEEKLRGLVPESFETYQIVSQGDLIIRSTDMQNDKKSLRTGLVKDRGIITSAYICLHSISNNSNQFNHWLLHGLDLMKVFYGLGSGLRQNLSWDDFKRLPLPLPPLLEQQQIAQYLDWKITKINKFIKAKKKLMALLKEQKQNIINEAVTKGINPDVKMKDSGFDWLGKVPDHWLIKKVRHFCTCQNGISESSDFFTDGFPFISYGDVYKNRVLPINVEGKAKSNEKQQINYSVKRGDIFFTRTSEVLDEIGITSVCFETIPNAIFSGFLIRVRPDAKIINEIFSKYYFQATCVREYFTKEMNIVTRASLGQNLLKNLPVLLPPFNEQIQIAEKLEIENNLIDGTISRAKKEIELIQEYQTRLISDVVTGKIDVRSIQVPDYEPIEADIDLSDENLTDDLVMENIEE